MKIKTNKYTLSKGSFFTSTRFLNQTLKGGSSLYSLTISPFKNKQRDVSIYHGLVPQSALAPPPVNFNPYHHARHKRSNWISRQVKKTFTWKRIVSRARGAVHVLLTAPANPPAARCAPMCRCSWRRPTEVWLPPPPPSTTTPTRASVCIARARATARVCYVKAPGGLRRRRGEGRGAIRSSEGGRVVSFTSSRFSPLPLLLSPFFPWSFVYLEIIYGLAYKRNWIGFIFHFLYQNLWHISKV